MITPAQIIGKITETTTLRFGEKEAITAAFSTKGRTKGYLLRTLPNSTKGELCRAAWLGLQPNAFKVNPYSVMSLTAGPRILYDKLSKFKFPAELDWDRSQLTKMEVW